MTRNHPYYTTIARLFAALTVLTLVGQSLSVAQSLSRYSASRATGITYVGITSTGNSFPSWRNSTNGNYNEDDNRTYPVDIGFDFWYNGVRYTQFSASTNGFIDLSSSTDDGGPLEHQYGPYDDDMSEDLSTETSPLVIAPFYLDLTTYGALDPLGESIHYLLSGTEGNRVLTVEWYRVEPWVAGGGGDPDFTFQVKLYESTGQIEFVYGAMNMNGFVFANQTVNVAKGYTAGMNGAAIGNPPTAAQLFLQQTPNATTFNHLNATGGETNLAHTLQTEPSSYSKITISPPVINAPYNLSFTGVTQTSMTLNWSDTLWNEVGFVIYRSDDGGATYNFITQTAANTTSYSMTGLLAGTTYYYRIFAVNEGRLSSALTGNNATTSPGEPITIASGLWNNPSIWSTNAVPTISDNATIADGHTVQINANVMVNSITIGQGTSGTLLIGNDNTPRSITVVGNIDVKANGTFQVNGTSATIAHTITTAGNILNAGVFNMATDTDSRCAVTFNKSGTQTISGSGSTTQFFTMTLNMGTSRSNVLDVFATNFGSSIDNFLTITNGTFNLATGATITPFTANTIIPLSGGIRVNHASAVLNTTGGSLTILGEFKVNNGTVNIGNGANNNLISRGGIFEFSGGTVNVAGRFEPYSNFDITDFTMSGGSLIVGTFGSTSTVNGPFTMNVAGSRFVFSGGSIVVRNEGGTGTEDLGYTNTGYSNHTVTGGTLQIGDASTAAAQSMRINTTVPVYNLLVNSSNAAAVLITNNLTVLNDVTITLGTLNANGLDMTVARNWTNSSQTFIPGAGKVTLSGTGAQVITDTGGETFYRLTVNKPSGTLTLANNVTVDNAFELTAGTINIGSTTLRFNGSVSGGGTLTTGTNSTVEYQQGSAGQNVIATNYWNLTLSNSPKIFPASEVGIAGIFASGTADGHTVAGNTIHYNGTGPQNVSSFRYQNLTLSNSSVKTIQTGADTVLGVLTINSGTILANNGITLRVFGNVVHAGTHSGTGSITLNGSSSQTLSGTGEYQNLTVNNSAGVNIAGNKTVNGTLTFTAGVLSTGSDTVTIAAGGAVSRTPSSGHVYGWLKKNIPNIDGTVVTFELGDASSANYTPVTFTFTDVQTSGTLTATTVNSEHPDINSSYIDPTANVNRYWQVVPNGFTYNTVTGYSVEFTFLNNGDLDATGNETSYRMNVFNGTAWDSTTAGVNTTTTNAATGVDSLGIYVLGLQVTSGAYRTKVTTGNWNATSTWERFNGTTWVAAAVTPNSTNAGLITIRSGHTVTVTANVTIDQTIIEAGGQITINGGTLTLAAVNNALVVNGTLRWQSSTLSGAAAVRLKFNAGSVYQHAMTSSARTAIPTATWDPGSTVEVVGAATQSANATFTGSLGQSFGHFTWNSTGQSTAIALGGTLLSVNGTFKVMSTGSSSLTLYGNQSTAMNVGGSFVVTGGTLIGKNNSNAVAINIGGNDSITGGSFTLSSSGALYLRTAGGLYVHGGTVNMSSGAATDSITIRGNLVLAGGTVTESSSGSGVIALNGTEVQTYSGGATISNNINFTVFPGAIFSPGTEVLSGQSFTLQSGGTLKIGSTGGIAGSGATGNIQTTSRSFSTGGNYEYNGASAQITGTGLQATVNKLIINNSAGVTVTASVAITDSLILNAGTFSIGSTTVTINNVALIVGGTLVSNAGGTVSYNKGSNGQTVLSLNYGNLIFNNFDKTLPAGSIGIAGSFTPGNATGHGTTGSTIDFNGTGAQTVGSWLYYNNLTISGTGTKTMNGNVTVNGTLTVTNGTLQTGIYTVTVKGNIVNNSVISGTNNLGKTLLTSGTTPHALSGTGSYWILELDDTYGATSSDDFSIDSLLVLTSGTLSMGAKTVLCQSLPGVYRPVAGGHVFGRIRKNIIASGVPQNYTFEIGDAANYTPIDLTFQSVSIAGTVTAFQTGGDHPVIKYSGLDQNKSVNRYFTISGAGITFTTYDATFNFVSSDIDAGANTAYFFVKRYSSPSWNPSTVNVRQSTSTRTLGLLAFGEFAVGEASTIFYWTKGAGTFNWGDDYNWSSHSKPTAGNSVHFDADDTIEVNIDAVCKDLILYNDTLRVTILAGKSLTVNGNLLQHCGQFITQNAFPAIVGGGTVTLEGGTFAYEAAGGSQTVSVQSYHRLRISGGGTKTAAGPLTVNKSLTIGSGTTFSDGGHTVTVKDSITNNGFHIGSGKILLNGITEHQLTGKGSFTNLELNNDANGAILDSTITVAGQLSLTNGVVTAITDTLYINATGSIVRNNGYVYGYLRKYFAPATVSKDFEIGSPSDYLPVTVTFGTITGGGDLTVSTMTGEHPDIVNSTVNQNLDINRYWTIKNDGILFDVYSLSVKWIGTEVTAGITDFSDLIMALRPSSGIWDELTPGATTGLTMVGTGGTQFGDFAVGKPMSRKLTSVITGPWSNAATWTPSFVPKRRDSVVIANATVVTLTGNSKIEYLAINNGGHLADGGFVLDLYGNFVFNGGWSGTGQIRWNEDAPDTLFGSNGTTTGTPTLFVAGSGKRITATNASIYRVQIAAGDSLVNSGSIQLTQLTGDDANSQWENAAGGSLSVQEGLLATGTLDAVSSNNTISYNGTGNQTIKPVIYYHLQTAVGGIKSVSGTTGVLGNLTIGASSTLDGSTAATTVYGNWTNNGTFTASSSTVVFAGSSTSTMSGATTFHNLTINKDDSTTAVNLSSGIQAATVAMTRGTIFTGTNTLTITNTRSGYGIINGTVTRTHAWTAGTPYEFESPYTTINFSNSGTLPTSVTVTTVLDSSAVVNSTMNPIDRYYTVSQSGGSGTMYQLKLHYEDSEIGSPNSETSPPLKLWRDSSSVWIRLGANANSTAENWVRYDSVMHFGTFTLSSRQLTNVALVLSSNATYPGPGDQVEYTVSFSNTGDGPATNFLVMAPIPLNTSYVPNSVYVNGVPAADGSAGVTVGPSALSINLSTILGGSIAPGASGNFKYKVTIN